MVERPSGAVSTQKAQSYGLIVATDRQLDRITHHSARLDGIAGVSSSLGLPLKSLFDPRFVHDLRNALGLCATATHRELVGPVELGGAQWFACATMGQRPIVELEPLDESSGPVDWLGLFSRAEYRIRAARDRHERRTQLLRLCRGLTGASSSHWIREDVGGFGSAVLSNWAPGVPQVEVDAWPLLPGLLGATGPTSEVCFDLQAPFEPVISAESESRLDLSMSDLRVPSALQNAVTQLGGQSYVACGLPGSLGTAQQLVLVATKPLTASSELRRAVELLVGLS